MPKYRIEGRVYDAPDPEQAYAMHDAATQSPGYAEGIVSQFNQGLTLGTADELAAAASGNYGESMRQQRQRREAFQREHPYLSAGAVAAGSVAPVAASMLAAPATAGAAPLGAGARALQLTLNALAARGTQPAITAGQVMAQGARTGGAIGGIAGYAGADPEAPGGRGLGAVEGALVGATGGAAIPGAMYGLERAASAATPALRRTYDALGMGGRGLSPMMPFGSGSATQPSVASTAEAAILRRMMQSGVSLETASAALENAKRQGIPLGLIDVGGQAVQRLARGVRTLPGEGSAVIDEALTQRSAQQPARVQRILERAIGRQVSGNAGQVSDDLLTQARQESGPFYERLKTLPPLQSQEIDQIFQTPAVRDIIRDLEAQRASWGRTSAPLYDADGNLQRSPTFSDINDVSRTINEMVRPQYAGVGRPIAGIDLSTQEGRSMASGLAQRLRNLADTQPGGDVFQAARESYAGPAEARRFYELGGDVTRPSTKLRDVEAAMGGTPAQRKWYQRGAVEALRESIGGVQDSSTQPNVLRAVAGNQNMRDKLQALTPERRRDALNTRLELERQANQTRNFVQAGSQTADKAAEALDTATEVGEAAIDATTGNVKGVATRALRGLYARVTAPASEAARVEIARQLTNFDNPAAQQEFLRRLQALQQQGQLRADQVTDIARAVSVQQTQE